MKIHIGCGPIYLTPSVLTDPVNGWLNVDLAGPKMYRAQDRPDLVESLSATDADYYGRFRDVDADKLRAGPIHPNGVCDAFGSFDRIPAPSLSADEILSRHVFEHLSIREAKVAIEECDRLLQPGGLLRLDVPDHDGTVEALVETKDKFFARHLFGSRRDDYGVHIVSYHRDALKALVSDYGFDFVEEEANPHFYPAFTFRFRKPVLDTPRWDYAFKAAGIGEIPAKWVCADFGCGPNPWPRANIVMDCYDTFAQNAKPGQKFMVGDIAYRIPLCDKEIDYATCFHVLEHVNCPITAAREISRIAKAGLVECPLPWKDILFNFHEDGHNWWVFPPETPGGPIIFKKANREWIKEVADNKVKEVMHRLLKGGPTSEGRDAVTIRRWFSRTEPHWNLIHKWEGELKVEVRT